MALSAVNSEMVREKAREAGDHLKDKLPPCNFLKARNPYAHVFERLKFHLGRSYRDCEDDQVPQILEIIEWYRSNPC
jgi:hypothetical protein